MKAGFLQMPGALKGCAEVIVRRGVIRHKPYGGFEMRDGFFGSAGPHQEVAQIVVSLYVVWKDMESLLILFDGFWNAGRIAYVAARTFILPHWKALAAMTSS